MATATVTAQPLDAAFCPATWQDVIDGFAPKLSVTYTENDEITIDEEANIGSVAIDDVFIGKESAEPFVGYLKIRADGQWQSIRTPVYYTDSSAAADSIVISTGTSRANAAFLADRLFVIRVANTNTGAVSITVDGIAAKGLRKNNSDDLAAGEIVAGQLIEVAYDSTDGVFEMISPVIATSTANIVAVVAKNVVGSGTSGQNVNSTAVTTLTLNTLVDPHSIASLNSNKITLPAGTYLADVFIPVRNSSTALSMQGYIYDTTGTAILATARTDMSGDTDDTSINIKHVFTLGAESDLELRVCFSAASANTYIGQAGGTGVDGQSETYVQASFLKLDNV